MSGTLAYHAGFQAERSVATHYRQNGHQVLAERWRSPAGEIDLIVKGPAGVIFVEVKKSQSHARAAHALRPRQIDRILQAAALFLDGQPDGQNSDARFDVALVDAQGRINVIENAICA